MNAEEARKLTQISEEQKFGYADVMQLVQKAALSGQSRCFIYQRIPDIVRQKLINEGYKFGTEHFDQRDGLTIELSW